MPKAIALILDYYAYDAGRYCTKQARLVCKAFTAIGIRGWMQEILKWKKPENNYQVPQLPPVELRIATLVDATERLEKLTGKLCQQFYAAVKDTANNMIMEANQRVLSPSSEDWRGVVSVAEEIGFFVPISGDHYRGILGSWVRAFAPSLTDIKEKRFCNETQQDIWVYPLHKPGVKNELEKQIRAFFTCPKPSAAIAATGWYKRNKS